jgi:hypothetical protein
MILRCICVVLLVGGAWTAVASADPPEVLVKLTLNKAAAERRTDDVLFECEATLDNATGRALNVRTSFFSAFDGVEIVLFDARGKKLRVQPYTFHQSPFAVDGTQPLEVGKTTKRLVFPVSGLPADVKTFRVCLIGTLPGSAYNPGLLLSDLVEVTLK